MNCTRCHHDESSHESVAYRGDKSRACYECANGPNKCWGFSSTPLGPSAEVEALLARVRELEGELRSVDMHLDRRDALADYPIRLDKISCLLKLAASSDPKGDLAKAEAQVRALAQERDEAGRLLQTAPVPAGSPWVLRAVAWLNRAGIGTTSHTMSGEARDAAHPPKTPAIDPKAVEQIRLTLLTCDTMLSVGLNVHNTLPFVNKCKSALSTAFNILSDLQAAGAPVSPAPRGKGGKHDR